MAEKSRNLEHFLAEVGYDLQCHDTFERIQNAPDFYQLIKSTEALSDSQYPKEVAMRGEGTDI